MDGGSLEAGPIVRPSAARRTAEGVGARVEAALRAALERATGVDATVVGATGIGASCRAAAPPTLAAALTDAVFPGGARVRPKLLLSIACATGDGAPCAADAAAAAIELLHCASLVHDDMPCFDDADRRRGRPTVHRAYGEPTALLAGDALIVLAFETIGRGCADRPDLLAPLLSTVAASVGAPSGIVAGQAWEAEAEVDLEAYHRAKTGALFVAAARAGALSSGADPEAWAPVGDRLGRAYQVADDLLDAVGGAADKPTGQDAAHDRPSAVARYGVEGATAKLRDLIAAAVDAIPDCAGAESLRDLVRMQATRLAPATAGRPAA